MTNDELIHALTSFAQGRDESIEWALGWFCQNAPELGAKMAVALNEERSSIEIVTAKAH